MRFFRFSLMVLLPFTLGCGSRSELGQVEGTIRAGGQPLANVVVTFVPNFAGPGATLRSQAQSDDKGHYQLRTESQLAGAVVGKHKVTVEDLAILSAPRSPDGTVLKRPPVRFPAHYSDPLRSPLEREVLAGSQVIDLDLAQ